MQNWFFVKTLLNWHQHENDRDLPWKKESDPYRIWLSEIILQQTRVAQGLSYYNEFTRQFPSIADLANADENTVFKLWEGLGYYNRCRNLIATAKFIHEERAGVFPDTYDDIIALKGVGAYTAAAIASFAFGLPHAVVDGNVVRVLSRFFGIAIAMDTTKGKRIIKELAEVLLDKENPSAYNQAIMDFGATVCKPAIPKCEVCPLQSECDAYKKGMVHLLPNKAKKVTLKKRFFNFFFIRHNNHIYIRQRREKDIWQNLFELPQIETKQLLTPQQLQRNKVISHFFKENGFRIHSISSPVQQRLTHQIITAQFVYILSLKEPDNFTDAIAVTPKELGKFAFPKIVAKYLFTVTTNDLL